MEMYLDDTSGARVGMVMVNDGVKYVITSISGNSVELKRVGIVYKILSHKKVIFMWFLIASTGLFGAFVGIRDSNTSLFSWWSGAVTVYTQFLVFRSLEE